MKTKVSQEKVLAPRGVKLFGRPKKINNLEQAQKLLTDTLSQYQRGRITDVQAKTISYLIQNFQSTYKANLETKGIVELINYKIEIFIRYNILEFEKILEKVADFLTEQESEVVDKRKEGIYEKLFEEKVKIRSELISEINKKTTLKVEINTAESNERKIEIILNHLRTFSYNEKCGFLEKFYKEFNIR